VRWYSPPDWTEMEASTEDSCSSDGSGSDSSSNRGHLSRRMRKEGMLVNGSTESLKQCHVSKALMPVLISNTFF